MKKTALILLGIIVLVSAAWFLLVKLLNPESFRPMVVKRLESALGRPVRLEKIALGWEKGLGFEVKGLTVYDAAAEKPIFQVDSIHAVVDLLPFLNREIKVGAVIIERPVLHLEKLPDGTFHGQEVKPAPVPKAEEVSEPGWISSLLPLLVSNIRLVDGRVIYQDRTAEEPVTWSLDKIGVSLRNVSLTNPVVFEAQAAFLDKTPNLHLSGQIRFSLEEATAYLEKFGFKAEIDTLNLDELEKGLPSVKQIGFKESPRGELSVTIDSAELKPEAMPHLKAVVRFDRGRLVFQDLGSPVENIRLEASLRAGHFDVSSLTADFGGGKFSATGKVQDVWTHPQFFCRGSLSDADWEKVISPGPDPNEPRLGGTASVSFEGQGDLISEQAFFQTFAGQGQFLLNHGVVYRLNILQEVFKRLSLLPGIVPKLKSRLPEEYLKKFEARDTYLEPLTVPFVIRNGVVDAPEFNLVTDTFSLNGTVLVTLAGNAQAQTMLVTDKELSAAMIGSVRELQYLTDPQGRIQIPLRVQGADGKWLVMPEVAFLASRLAVSKTQEIFGELFQKARESKNPPSDAGGAPSAEPSAAQTSGSSTAPQAQTSQSQTPAEMAGNLLHEFLKLAGSPDDQKTGP